MLITDKSDGAVFGACYLGPADEAGEIELPEAFADTVKKAKVCYIGGVSTVEGIERAMAEFDFIEMARALIADPALVEHVREDPSYVNPCNHCNKCATLIEAPGGIYCVERPANFN